jgi:hypothetical protein
MKLPGTRVIVFNVAAGIVTIAAVVAVVRSLLHTPQLAPCTQRYASGTVFSLEHNGALLTSTDLQTRLSGKDVGLGDNVEIARIKDGPAPVAISVTLAKGSIAPHVDTAPKGGVTFAWEPRSMPVSTSIRAVRCPASAARTPSGPTNASWRYSLGAATARWARPPS